ncbi:unnamed protein product [Albugo candida]|uniref:Uncharacterized protein n=1 Tax=Albugo candida TaxID=65357 RepID=A0A024GBV7_9STRA|nr:unnamed protein product [Albugo candida]|eukprot:CCI44337.1 unnamed protein product [Albugo candida]
MSRNRQLIQKIAQYSICRTDLSNDTIIPPNLTEIDMRFVFQYPVNSILCVDSSYIIPLYDIVMRIVMDHNERYNTSDSSFSRFRMESFKVVFASNCCSQIYFNNNTRVDRLISE